MEEDDYKKILDKVSHAPILDASTIEVGKAVYESTKNIPPFDASTIQAEKAVSESMKRINPGIIESMSEECSRIAEVIGKISQPHIINYLNNLGESTQNNLYPLLQKIPNEVIDSITEFSKIYSDSLANIFTNTFPHKVIDDKNFHDKIREEIETFNKNGWYLDYSMGLEWMKEIENYFKTGKKELGHKELVIFFKNNLEAIKTSLVTLNPERRDIINEAFEAHAQGKYLLSVPVLIAQADGICTETFQNSFFTKSNENIKKQLKKITNSVGFSTLLNISNLPIQFSKKNRSKNFSDLNRHQILHGEIFDYGTEEYEYKAISFINYISSVCDKYRKLKAIINHRGSKL